MRLLADARDALVDCTGTYLKHSDCFLKCSDFGSACASVALGGSEVLRAAEGHIPLLIHNEPKRISHLDRLQLKHFLLSTLKTLFYFSLILILIQFNV